jgi:hypothetical protein
MVRELEKLNRKDGELVETLEQNFIEPRKDSTLAGGQYGPAGNIAVSA